MQEKKIHIVEPSLNEAVEKVHKSGFFLKADTKPVLADAVGVTFNTF
jgi:hypothetical protein